MVELDKTQSSDKKLLLLAGFMFSCLFVLAAGLWRVQVMQSKQYVDRMNDQYKVLVRIPPVRGKIFDAQNLPLAENRPSFTINLYFEELRELWREEYFKLKKARLAAIESEENRKRSLRSKERDEINKQARFNVIERVVSELGVIMGEDLSISREDFEKHYIQQLSMPLPVMTDVSLAHATRFLESSSLPAGFEIDYQPMRTYPYGDLASQTLGFVRRKKEYSDKLADNTKYQLPDYEGIAGLESHFDEDLRGTPGIKNVTVNNLGYCIGESIATPPKPGKNLYLTLDADIQRVAQEAIATANGPDTKGAVVVMDSYSGDLIALASNPGFNPNDFVPQISSQKYNDYLRAEDPTFKTFRNRCVSERYQPGSVFKIVVSMGLLETDFFNPDEIIDTMWVYASGPANSGIRIKDTAAPGQYNFIRAFKKSSNYYFVEMGLKLGRESMVNISKRLGFDQRTQLPIMQGAAGIIPSDEYLSKHRIRATTGLTANLSIGQGEIDVTPLHIAQLMACIANNGRIPQPRLVSAIESQASKNELPTRELFPNQSQGFIQLSPRTLDYIRQGLLADVEDPDGTGHLAYVPDMSIGGKTGTAESRQRRTTWFASMAPVDAPQFVVVVMVEDGAGGGKTCAPVAKIVYQAIKKKYFNGVELLNREISNSGMMNLPFSSGPKLSQDNR